LKFHVGALLFLLSGTCVAAPPACEPFSVYRGVVRPDPWKKTAAEEKIADEGAWLGKISKVKGHAFFPKAFREWEAAHPADLNSEERLDWLRCVAYYLAKDTDGDGIPDWSALVDGRPSPVLFPADDDIDGDGTPNVLDPNPFDSHLRLTDDPKTIPAHLKIRRPEVALLQEQLFHEFGLLAIDHTDEHSPVVLESILFLFRHAFPGSSVRNLGNLKYIYAFAGHDAHVDIAAYHFQAKAISVGGVSAYGRENAKGLRIDILESVAHEVGHAFLLDRMTPSELRGVSERFGGWASVFGTSFPLSFYAPVFFIPHPALGPAATPPARLMAKGRKFSLVSSYALHGVHEWFAEAFAAAILEGLGKAHLLGTDWKSRLVGFPRDRKDYWFNYNNVQAGFSSWLERKLTRKPKTAANPLAQSSLNLSAPPPKR
jgi:hypothetical protein